MGDIVGIVEFGMVVVFVVMGDEFGCVGGFEILCLGGIE